MKQIPNSYFIIVLCIIIAPLLFIGFWLGVIYIVAGLDLDLEKETWYPEKIDVEAPEKIDVGATEEFEEMLGEFEIKVEE